MKEMVREARKELVNKFLLNLKTALEQKRFKFDLKLIGKHSQLYRFYVKNRTHFLFIHASRGNRWEIPSPRIEISPLISSENIDWAVILLKEPEAKNHLLGFLILGDDFIKMKAGFSMTRMGLIRIKEKDLSLKYQFNNWDTFFQLLKLKL
jgi:hypothetical protein